MKQPPSSPPPSPPWWPAPPQVHVRFCNWLHKFDSATSCVTATLNSCRTVHQLQKRRPYPKHTYRPPTTKKRAEIPILFTPPCPGARAYTPLRAHRLLEAALLEPLLLGRAQVHRRVLPSRVQLGAHVVKVVVPVANALLLALRARLGHGRRDLRLLRAAGRAVVHGRRLACGAAPAPLAT